MNKKRIYALGFFDGVHLGHQALLKECVRLAAEMDCTTAAITFDRHPQALFTPQPPALITTAADREALLRHYGIAQVRLLPVTAEVMGKPWKVFLEELVADGAAGFVCGDDFHFGRKGEGDGEKLKDFCAEQGLSCVIVPEQTLDGRRICSSYIRQQLQCGDMATAVKFLGHPYFLRGTVIPGRRLGRTIGVPTANILIPEGIVVPKLGVYACECIIDGETYTAVTNIGSRPTVEGHQTRAESWILDFDGDLYGREITLELHKFLRPEQKFGSLEELKEQIQRDAAQVTQLLG